MKKGDKMSKNYRLSLRESGYLKKNKTPEKGSLFIRFNICMTITVAVILLSKIDLDITKNISGKIENIISSETDTEGLKQRAADVYTSFMGGEKTEKVFSDIDEDLAEQIRQQREQEENLKNR